MRFWYYEPEICARHDSIMIQKLLLNYSDRAVNNIF
jgi:hypothetical protein